MSKEIESSLQPMISETSTL